jgi:hypothetical protein
MLLALVHFCYYFNPLLLFVLLVVVISRFRCGPVTPGFGALGWLYPERRRILVDMDVVGGSGVGTHNGSVGGQPSVHASVEADGQSASTAPQLMDVEPPVPPAPHVPPPPPIAPINVAAAGPVPAPAPVGPDVAAAPAPGVVLPVNVGPGMVPPAVPMVAQHIGTDGNGRPVVINVPNEQGRFVLVSEDMYRTMMAQQRTVLPAMKPKPFSCDAYKSKTLRQLEQWLAQTEAFLAAQNVPHENWTRSAITYLEGTIWDDYHRAKKMNADEHLIWPEFVALLKDIVTDSEVSKAALLKEIRDFRFLTKAVDAKEEPSLSAVLREFMQLLGRLPADYPEDEKCIHLLNALPKEVIKGKMTDPFTLEPWKDFARLCRYAKYEWSEPFREVVKEKRGTNAWGKRPKDGPKYSAVVTKKVRTDVSPVQPTNPRFRPEVDVPQYLRHAMYKAGDKWWSQGSNQFPAGACLACGRMGHAIINCRGRKKLFDEGRFFYYPSDWRSLAAQSDE